MFFSSPACWEKKQQLSGVVLSYSGIPKPQLQAWPCKGNLFLCLQLHKTEPNQQGHPREGIQRLTHVGRGKTAWFNLSSPAVSFLVG